MPVFVALLNMGVVKKDIVIGTLSLVIEMFSSMSEFEIDTSTCISHFTDPFVDLHPTYENIDYPTSTSNIFSADS